MHNNELYHYGVIGMKWGVRRGNTAKAYQKASKKLDKLDKKVSKAENKVINRAKKNDDALASRFSSKRKRNRAQRKVAEAAASYRNSLRKANKWYKSMEKTFAKTDVKLTTEQVKRGKKYVNRLSTDALIHY